MQKRSLTVDAISGAAAGLVAAALMNRFQAVWSKASEGLKSNTGDRGGHGDENHDTDDDAEPATIKAAKKIHAMVSSEALTRNEQKTVGTMVHYAFGAALGVIYVMAARRFPAIRASYGTAYGTGVSIVADEVLVPATGLSPPPTKASVSSHIFGLVSHIVFGAALDGSRRLIARAAA